MSGGFNVDDYVDVAERISQFYERFPDGRLVTGRAPHVVEIAGKPFVWYHARAYRTPDDPLPGDGWAAEPVPGPTQFTRDSELMNAETAAWGRAIVALGFETKKIASAQEVRNRQKPDVEGAAESAGYGGSPSDPGRLVLGFGKHKGKSLRDLIDEEPSYVEWLSKESKNEDVRASALKLLELQEIPF